MARVSSNAFLRTAERSRSSHSDRACAHSPQPLPRQTLDPRHWRPLKRGAGAQVAAALPNLLRRAAASKLASASPRWTPENPPPPPPPPGSSWTADNPASPSPNIGGDAPIGVSPEEWRLLHLTKAQLEAEAAGRAWR